MQYEIDDLDVAWAVARVEALGGRIGFAEVQVVSPEKVRIGTLTYYPDSRAFQTPKGLLWVDKLPAQHVGDADELPTREFAGWLGDYAQLYQEELLQ